MTKKIKTVKIKPAKVFNSSQMNQFQGLINNALSSIMDDCRPIGRPVKSYQESMGHVLGWSDDANEAGPVYFGTPSKESWPPGATHYTIPVRPYKYEV